ncbi:MAG: ribose-5-phosphate isomerase RpiA [Asticcacaulis sp.]
MSLDVQKQAVGEAAAAMVEDGMCVGLGTGSTAAFFVKALGTRVAAGLKIRCVSTSVATAELAASLGMTLLELNDAGRIDLCVDGADEIGPGLALIKGGGAALLREKLVWEASDRCVTIADHTKVVKALGAFALPIEVVAFGHKTTANRIADVLAEFDIGMAPRLRVKDGQPVRTDGGNVIYDAACGVISEPAALAAALKATTGVVEHGLFLDLAEEALVATLDGVERLYP